MSTLYQVTQFKVGSDGLTIPLGPGLKFWLSIAVDPIEGQPTGTNVTLDITGRQPRETITVAYGAPQLKRKFSGRLIRVTGTGAYIELWISTEEVEVTPTTLPITAAAIPITGNVNADITASIQLGVTPTGGDLTSGNEVVKSVTTPIAIAGPVQTQALDVAGNPLGVSFAGLGIAPATGIWHFIAIVSAAGDPLQVNGQTLLPDGFSGDVTAGTLTMDARSYTFAVVLGQVCTITGGTVISGVVTSS